MLDLDAIKKREQAATPGPWYVSEPHEDCGEVWIHTRNAPPVESLIPPYSPEAAGPDFDEKRWREYYRENIDPSLISTGWEEHEVNAAFVAHARTDILALISEVERIRNLALTYGAPRYEVDGAESCEEATP